MTSRDQVLNLRYLPFFAGIGGLHGHLGAQLRGGGDKIIAVARPALDPEIVNTEANFRLVLACMSQGRKYGQTGEHRSTDQRSEHGTAFCRLHVSLLFMVD